MLGGYDASPQDIRSQLLTSSSSFFITPSFSSVTYCSSTGRVFPSHYERRPTPRMQGLLAIHGFDAMVSTGKKLLPRCAAPTACLTISRLVCMLSRPRAGPVARFLLRHGHYTCGIL
jgi:hypothetical protein